MKKSSILFFLLTVIISFPIHSNLVAAKEIREYQGQRLDPFDRAYDNSIHCVEGWTEHLLFEGVRLSDLLSLAKPRSKEIS